MADNSRARYRLLIIASAFLFSTGGVAIKASTFSAWQVAGFRSGVAAVVLFACIPRARRSWNWPMIWTAFAYAATLICFVLANKLTTSANAIFLQSTAPLYMLFFSPAVLREKVGRADLAVFAAIGLGITLLLHGSQGGQVEGDLIGLLSGLTWASTLTGLRWLGKREKPGSAEATVALGNLIAFTFCLPFALPIGKVAPSDIAIVTYLGAFQIALAYICLTRSIRHVPALQAATLLLIEPVFNPTLTWLIRGENPGVLAVIGGAIISLSVLGGAWWNSRPGMNE